MRKKNKNNYTLLPYIRESVYGLDPTSKQFSGWPIEKLDIKSQWKYSRGTGVVVAVIDTGCDLDHPDLQENLLDGKNTLDNGSPSDDNGHGSHVCGTIAAKDNDFGMVGVAPETKIIPIKALDKTGNGSIKHILDGIYYAIDREVDFITMSLGSPHDSTDLSQAIKIASSKGIIIFCAAGNSGPNSDIMYPARYEEVISIAAVDEELRRTNFSCSGDSLDFLAPGHNILSTVPNNTYALMSGTSMSNPFVVGCASLLLSYNRQHNKYKLDNQDDYLKVLSSMCIPIQDKQFQSRKYQGYGILKLNLS